jgi:hypothetical protein
VKAEMTAQQFTPETRCCILLLFLPAEANVSELVGEHAQVLVKDQ